MKSESIKPSKPRLGRPRAVDVGNAEERILEAATLLFLEQGFGRTTLDQVSAKSHAGKSTLYDRYLNKENLFSAVVHRSIEKMFSEINIIPVGITKVAKLRHVLNGLLQAALLPRCVKLMRIVAAESENFPELAQKAYAVSFEGSVNCVREILNFDEGKQVEASELSQRIVMIALQPLAFQAIMGGNVVELLANATETIDDALDMFFASGLLEKDL